MKNVLILCAFLLTFPGSVIGASFDKIEKQIADLRSEYESRIMELENQLKELQEVSEKQAELPSNVEVTWDRNLRFRTNDGNNALNIKGRIQPRFEYETRQNPRQNNHSSFFLRRVRLDFTGHIRSKDLTFRIMPEFAREANLRDAWFNYRFASGVQLRFGQFQIPFNWERDNQHSSNRHQFVERSVAGEEFLWGDGRDIGIMVHGVSGEKFVYSAGVYSGQGRNKRRSDSSGVVLAGRAAYVVSGKHPTSEALLKPVSGSNFLVGAGAYHAAKNSARDWHTWSGGTTEPADLAAFTGDLAYQTGGMSVHFSRMHRKVNPLNPALARYSGNGFNSQIGYLLRPEKMFSALRYSESRPNRSEDLGRSHEAFFTTQFFLSGHDSKLSLELGRIRTHTGGEWQNTDISRLQYQLLF